MDYTKVTDLKYASADGSAIDCMVKFSGMEEAIPFTATADDSTSYGVKIYEEAVAGEWGKIAKYTDPASNPSFIQKQNQSMKAHLLEEAESAIAPLTRAVKYDIATDAEKSALEAWERYTVLLSRVDVDNPVWPDVPEKTTV